jgi:hypothetical protein
MKKISLKMIKVLIKGQIGIYAKSIGDTNTKR